MRLLFFSPYFYPYLSGLTVYPFKLLQQLAKTHQVSVLTFRDDPALKSEETMFGFTVKRLNYNFRLSKGFLSLPSLGSFWQALAATDLLFLNLPGLEGLPLAIMAKIKRVQVLSLYHCQVDLGPRRLDRLVNFFLNLGVWWQLKLSDRVVAYTQDYLDSLPALAPLKSKFIFIPPLITVDPVSQTDAADFDRLKGRSVWIGFAGRLAREKGLEYLIRAVARLPHPERYELVLAGPSGPAVVGEAAYSRSILELLRQTSVKHRFLGVLTGSRLSAFYQTLDILVLPSVNRTEAFGMVQVEAMLNGTPVIATDLPGVRVPIQTTHMGLLVPARSPEALTQALTTVLNHRTVFTNPHLTGRAKTLFAPPATLAAYDHLFKQFGLS